MTADFTRSERRLLLSLSTPEKVQKFLDEKLEYNRERGGETCRSPRRVMCDRTAHCMEGALLASVALRLQGHTPQVMQLHAVRDDDHVVALFRFDKLWGAVAKSNYSGLRFREPVYRSLRELIMSYFEHYFNLAREKTLRGYSRALDLRKFDHTGWMTAEEDLWAISEALSWSPSTPLLSDAAQSRLNRVDGRLFRAGCLERT